MKNCKIDHVNHKIIASNAFMRKATVPFSAQYTMLRKLMKDLPGYAVEVMPVQMRKNTGTQQKSHAERHQTAERN